MQDSQHILLVEDDPIWSSFLRRELCYFGEITLAEDEDAARELMQTRGFDIAFIDLDLKESLAGLELAKEASALGLYNVVVSSHSSNEVIRAGLTRGCSDYLVKPGRVEALRNSLDLVMHNFKKFKNESNLQQKIRSRYVSEDGNTYEQLQTMTQFTPQTSGVFIVGESGTGKKLVAELAQELIAPQKKLIKVNCAAINPSTMLSELFGHTRGAFTGALQDKKGLLERASGGVLFLDEVHEMSLEAQKALLVAIEDQVITRVGGERPIKVDLNIICAAREEIDERLKQKRFLPDLYYRLCRRRIDLFPLRERPQDIMLQLNTFLAQRLDQNSRFLLDDGVAELLKNYTWPGNTRELENLVESWLEKNIRLLKKHHLPDYILQADVLPERTPGDSLLSPRHLQLLERQGLNRFMDQIKKEAIQLAQNKFPKSDQARARYLKIGRSTMNKYRREYMTP